MKFPFWPDQIGYRNIDLGLTRVLDLLARLDNPHLKLPKTIHLAGTNGKGSTLAFLRAIFQEAGLKIHAYTSPHLVNFNERIVLSGKEISDDFLNEILQICKDAAETEPKIPVTYFEGITVAAFLAFSKVKADILLLEVGMGGRLDATNVLPKVLCSIITPISFDHEEFLGDSLDKIAFEKAGIIKENCAVIVGKQEIEALQVIEKQAQKNNCRIFSYKNYLNLAENSALIGSHQIQNAATAIAAVKNQTEFQISDDSIKKGIKNAFWPARLQKINSGKFFEKLPKNCELYLDGSHNLAGAKTVKEFLQNQKEQNPNLKIVTIFGMLKDKACEDFLKEIKDEISQLIAIKIPDEEKSQDPNYIAQIARNLGINAKTATEFEDAFEEIKNGKDALILVCGSLYLAGAFLSNNN